MEENTAQVKTIIPQNIMKIVTELDTLRSAISQNKKNSEELLKQFTIIDKKLSKYLNVEINIKLKAQIKKNNRAKRPRGFAIPKLVSPALLHFLEKPENTKMSRTEVTTFLTNYIKTKGLIDPNNKKLIVPDEALWNILGENARHEEKLDRFKMQKYLNQHFNWQ
jgi:chromatin remodeling complex protein RSC6